MTQHTPGPWVQWADTNIVIRLHTGRPQAEDLRICEVATNTWKDEGRHNARLIAAAPDLLAALESVWLWMENQADGQSKGGHATFDLMMLREQRDIARAAIAKATGQA